ncbi:hypothetical protein CROQUDRAFT_49314 [Cronartium quercuum f. sp. fusiforme G11]|uniref:alpha-1,2-Mannosidase n=1 Tax=Cronartium quercuum f. sp. fusiforme G11 TaxID=708437 RepID=A0A9P6NBH8_9BASI|nr:hypothetical protein CROQUDRAFT_49314 [Cronartium quercuum f. sp. fusiforme G11]
MRSTLCKGRTRRRHRSSKGFLPSSWILMAIISGSLMWLSTTHAIKIQADHIHSLPESQARADVIRDTFKRGWKTYRAHAWGHDENNLAYQTFFWSQLLNHTVGALSLKPSNTRNGWGATLVDSLSTLQVMGLSAVKHVHRIDFTKTNDSVSVSESTVSLYGKVTREKAHRLKCPSISRMSCRKIRYIGGLLSAYEGSARTEPILLSKAVQLADKLMFAWQNQSVLPFGYINFTNDSVYTDKGRNITNLAAAGSLLLEFYKLSKHTYNETYYDMAEATMKAIMNNKAIWPGLHSVFLDPMDARPIAVSWGPAADSFYEYLNKYSLMTGNLDPSYLDHWALAVDSSIKYLMRTSSATSSSGLKFSFLFWSKAPKERTYLASRETHGGMAFGMSHLECFVGGNFMLGGKMLGNETIIEYGLKLTETCADSYSSTRSGVGPESFFFIDKETRKTSLSGEVDLNFYDQYGFIPSGRFMLRPEVIESMFYAYRITGDSIWQTRAWKAWQAIENCCQVSKETGLFASITDVNRIPTRNFSRALRLQKEGPDGWEDGPFRETPEYDDYMESFWWGETLKSVIDVFKYT